MRTWKRVICILSVLVLTPLLATAQTAATATVTGTVSDPTGAVVPGAAVELREEATNTTRRATTDASGQYLFASVAPGVYRVSVTMQGFRQAVVQAVKVGVAKSYLINVTLEVGEVAQTVEVAAGAQDLQTHDATVGTTIGGDQLLRLPTINRSAAALLTVQPMVQPARGQGVLGGGQVAGARSDQNTFNLDGADSTDLVAGTSGYTAAAIDFEGQAPMIPVPAESIEEFRVGTINPNASFGRSAGGQVNLVSKRGKSTLHGSAYWYHQNDNMNSNRWEFNRAGIRKPELKDNRFGFSVGGPIWPERLFMYGHYEGRRFPRSESISRLVPSSSLRAGMLRFRDAANNVVSYNITSFDPRGIGLSSVISTLWNRLPPGNDTTLGDGLNTVGFRAAVSAPIEMDFAMARVDYNLSSNWHFYGTYRFASQSVTDVTQLDIAGISSSSSAPIATAITPVEPRFLSAKLTGQFSPRMTTEFVFGWARNWWAYKRVPPQPQVAGTAGALMIALGNLDQGIDVDTQRARSRTWWDHVYQYTSNTTWIAGKHAVEWGGSWRRMPVYHIRDDKVVGSLAHLVYELNARTAVSIPASSRPPTCGGSVTTNCLASGDVGLWNDLLAGALGIVDKAGVLLSRDANLNPLPLGTPLLIEAQFHAFDLYAQDRWRITPTFNVTLGLTYSIQTPPVDKNGKQTRILDAATGEELDAATYFGRRRAAALQGQVYNPTLGYLPIRQTGKKSIYDTDWNNFGPRVAAAWNPSFTDGFFGMLFGQGKMVWRGGYGLTFDRTNAVGIIMIPILGVGFAQTLTCIGPRSPTTSTGTCAGSNDINTAFRIGPDGSTVPLPPIGPATSPVVPATGFSETLSFSIDPKLTIGKSHSIDFTIQRELPWNMLLEVGYAGRMGRNLQQSVQLSSVPYFMRDTASGQTLAQAYDAVAAQLRGGTATTAVTPQPWFENQLAGATLCTQPTSTTTVTSCTAGLAVLRATPFIQGQLNSLFTLINGVRPAGPIINTQILDLWVRVNGGRSNYNAGFVSLTKRMSGGHSFTVNYTLSRTLDQFGLNQEFIGVSSNGFDLDLDYGPALWDRTHVFNGNWYYELPFGRGKRWSFDNPVAERIFGGWYSSGIVTTSSGLPLTVVQHAQTFGGDPLNFAIGAGALSTGRRDFSNSLNTGIAGSGNVGTNGNPATGGSGLNLFPDPEAVFNAFRHIRLAQDGRHGRGALRGFPRWNVDLSVGKRTRITERVDLAFTFDMINAFNHAEFNDPTLSLTNPRAFGVITSQFANPRQIQLGFRVEF